MRGRSGVQVFLSIAFIAFLNCPLNSVGQCFSGRIAMNNPSLAIDCVNPQTVVVPLRPGDEFSAGNLNDFCLRSEVSFQRDLPTPGVYEGVGKLSAAERLRFPHLKSFGILDQLVNGTTWSYQADGRIEIANMDWPSIQRTYDAQFKREIQDKIDRAFAIRADITRRNDTFIKFTVPIDKVAERQALLNGHQNTITTCTTGVGVMCIGSTLADAVEGFAHETERVALYQRGVDEGAPALLATMTAQADQLDLEVANATTTLSPFDVLVTNTKRFPTPDFEAPNPYFVEVTGIKIDNEILKNFLHIRVFMNRSVSDARPRLHTAQERNDKALGRMKGFLLMVKDQDGWPVGDFSLAIPCSKTCTKYGRSVFTHDSRNDLPCSYTPPQATTHPGMFVWPSDDQVRTDGIREVHATWSFAQDSCNFVTELHFQTLIMEDFVERPGSDFLRIPFPFGRPHYFGWTARYSILHPTRNSLGAADYVNVRDLRDLNRRGSHIDCHVRLEDSFGFIKGRVPFDSRDIPTHTSYFLQLMSEFPTATTPEVRYFGQHLNNRLRCRDISRTIVPPAQAELTQFFAIPDVSTFTRTPGLRCPCPALPTTPRPDDDSVTPDPSRLHGRLLHGSHMALAWMVLVPLAFFVARFYKETFSTVFCFQEYWWYMWHVGLMLAATAFVMGGILSVSSRKNISKLAASDLLILHNIFGAISIVVFYIQIFTGFFRAADLARRLKGIFFHWLIGTLNQISAISCVIMMGFVKQSGMTCNALIVSGAWVFFYIAMFGIMEFNLRITDRKLELKPPRSYLPPPTMRLFGVDAPGRIFRIVMLGVFIIGLLGFYFLIIYYIWHSEGLSCKDELGEAPDEETAIVDTNYVYESIDDN